MTTEKRISEALAAEFDKQIAEKESQLKALAAKEYALTETIRELEEAVGERLDWLAKRKEYETMRAKCKAFAEA